MKLKQQNIAIRVSIVSVAVNLILSVFKLIAGIIAHSGAMVSDAVHSASDVLSTFIVMIGVHISNKQSDKEHPYGHERLESVASLLLAIMLAVTGAGIGYSSAMVIHNGSLTKVQTPGVLALIAAIISIVVKEWLYWYTRCQAKKINSTALMADAWHHRSDALSSIGALIGIAGARMGYPLLDPIAGLVICIFIEKAAVEIFKDSLDRMVDKSCSEDVVGKISDIILEVEGVEGIDDIKTRLFGAKIYVDVEILVDGNKTLKEAHEIAEAVHDLIEETMPEVKHCMVHENPR
ncbi:MAG: cation diffusion facilitator family transporter [Lachnospiraceae bacterium]|nr:cation diffusion facilitator family transporter [Lachnospiraceae bacterium]